MNAMERIRALMASVVLRFYFLVLGKSPGSEAKSFIRNVGYIFVTFAVAKVLATLFQIYTGRMLGTVEYGKFSLVISLMQIFAVPMMMGISSSMIKYVSENRDGKEKREIFTAGSFLIVILALSSALVIYAFAGPISGMLGITGKYVTAAIILAFFYSGWVISQKMYQSFGKMKKLGVVNILMNSMTLGGALLAFMYARTAIIPLAIISVAYVIASLPVLPELRENLTRCIRKKWVKTLLSYGFVMVVGMASIAITDNINKILLTVFLSFEEVGLYQAYFFSTLNVAAFFTVAVTTVLFPQASRIEERGTIYRQVGRVVRMTPLLYPIILGASSVILLLYGSGYVFVLPLLLMFAAAAILSLSFNIYGCLSISEGMRGVKINAVSVSVVSIVNIVIAFMLIPPYGIYGAIASTLTAYLVGLVFIRAMLRRAFGW